MVAAHHGVGDRLLLGLLPGARDAGQGLGGHAVQAAELGLATGLVGTTLVRQPMVQRGHSDAGDGLGPQDAMMAKALGERTAASLDGQLT